MKRIDGTVDPASVASGTGGSADGVAAEAGLATAVKTRSFNEAAHKLEDWPTHPPPGGAALSTAGGAIYAR